MEPVCPIGARVGFRLPDSVRVELPEAGGRQGLAVDEMDVGEISRETSVVRPARILFAPDIMDISCINALISILCWGVIDCKRCNFNAIYINALPI